MKITTSTYVSRVTNGRARDSDATRKRILDAATIEFAARGLGGARVDWIAGRSEANVRMLYYYFGSKDKLFLAVIERVYDQIRNAEKTLELDLVEPAEGMRRLIVFSWEYYFKNPDFITLLNSENLHQARHLRQSSRIVGINSPLVDLLRQLLERGARNGIFRRNVDPVQLYITIASLGYFYLSNRHTLSAIFGRDLMAKEQLAARLQHIVDVVFGFLRPDDKVASGTSSRKARAGGAKRMRTRSVQEAHIPRKKTK